MRRFTPFNYQEIAGALKEGNIIPFSFYFALFLSLSHSLVASQRGWRPDLKATRRILHGVDLGQGPVTPSPYTPSYPALLLRPIFRMIKSFNLLLEFWRCALFWFSCNFRISWRDFLFVSLFYIPLEGALALKGFATVDIWLENRSMQHCMLYVINFHFYGS